MFLHQISTTMPRTLLCATPRQALLACSLQPRCPPKGCTSMHIQGVSVGLTVQHARWYWWPGQQQEFSKTCGRIPVPLRLRSSYTAQYVTTHTQPSISSKAGGLSSVSDTTEKEEENAKALIELEIELNRQEGRQMPSKITEKQWKELLTRTSVFGRRKYLNFLFKNECKTENKKKLQQINKEKREEAERLRRENPSQEGGHIEYGLWKNSIFMKILDSTMNRFYHGRVVQAMRFGQPLVVDMGFDENMNSRERQNCAYQVQMMIAANREHDDPYSLELHNASPTQDTMVRLERYIPIMYKPEYPLIVNSKSYLDKYPKERLVYLTPHTREELSVYDHDAVYIIGGIVDKSSGEPLTLAKARKEGIRMQKLPLERYLSWGLGNKCLTLNQIINIMLDMKVTGDWSYAFRHVPRRKLRLPHQSQQSKEQALLRRIQQKDRGFSDYWTI